MRKRVGHAEGQQHRRQHGEVLQVFGNRLPSQQKGHDESGQRADHDAAADRRQKNADGVTLLTRHDRLVDQHGEQRAQRVDHDAFPAQRVADTRIRPHRAQHGCDHGRPGDAGQRAEQQRDRPAQAGHDVRSQCQQQQRCHRTVADQPPHHVADTGKLVKTQAQAALEQDQRHRQRDDGKQQAAEQLVRIDQAGDRPQQDAGQQQKQDRRQLHPPRQPLRQKADHQHAGKHQAQLDSHSMSLDKRQALIGPRTGGCVQ